MLNLKIAESRGKIGQSSRKMVSKSRWPVVRPVLFWRYHTGCHLAFAYLSCDTVISIGKASALHLLTGHASPAAPEALEQNRVLFFSALRNTIWYLRFISSFSKHCLQPAECFQAILSKYGTRHAPFRCFWNGGRQQCCGIKCGMKEKRNGLKNLHGPKKRVYESTFAPNAPKQES